MLVIRLQRIGKKHNPHYRLVVAEKRSKLGAPPVEDLGSYNPSTKANTISKDRVDFWMSKGAQPSITVHNLLVNSGILNAPKIKLNIKVVEAEKTEAPSAEAEAGSAEVPSEEVAPETAAQ